MDMNIENVSHLEGQDNNISHQNVSTLNPENNQHFQQNISFFNEQLLQNTTSFSQDLNTEIKPFQHHQFQFKESNIVTDDLNNFLPGSNTQLQLPHNYDNYDFNVTNNNNTINNNNNNIINTDIDFNNASRGYQYPVGFPHHLTTPPPELPDLPLLNSYKQKFPGFDQINTVFSSGPISVTPLVPVPELQQQQQQQQQLSNNNNNNNLSQNFGDIDFKSEFYCFENPNLFVSKESSQSEEVIQQNKQLDEEKEHAQNVQNVVNLAPNVPQDVQDVQNAFDPDQSIVNYGAKNSGLETNQDGSKKRTSKYRGVTKHRRSGRWEAHIWVKSIGRQVYLGGYNNEEHAAEAYDVAAIKCKGPNVKTNFNITKYSELMKCMDSVTLDELVMAVRRQSQGFARGTSAYRGVTRHPNNSWESRIGIPGSKHIYLGLFNDEKQAAQSYDRALVRLRGTIAATNFAISNYRFELAEYHKMQKNVFTGRDVEQVLGTGAEFERWIKFGFEDPQCMDIQNPQCMNINLNSNLGFNQQNFNSNLNFNQYQCVVPPQFQPLKKQRCETLEQVDESNGGNVDNARNVNNARNADNVRNVDVGGGGMGRVQVDFNDLDGRLNGIFDGGHAQNQYDLDATMFKIFNSSNGQGGDFSLEIEGQTI